MQLSNLFDTHKKMNLRKIEDSFFLCRKLYTDYKDIFIFDTEEFVFPSFSKEESIK